MFGLGDRAAFLGIQTMDFNITFIGNLARMWSHAAGTTLTSVTVDLVTGPGSPTMLFNYITPSSLQPIPPRGVVYPYYTINRFPTDSLAPIASGAAQTLDSANIQLQSIPKRMYILARRKNSNETFLTTDTFFAIEGISVNWNNNSGLLSSATQQDLYRVSVRNGCNYSWPQWAGRTVDLGPGNPQRGLTGSVLCLEFGRDIGLGPMECPKFNPSGRSSQELGQTASMKSVLLASVMCA